MRPTCPLAGEAEPLACFLKFQFQRENPIAIASGMAASASQMALPPLPNFEHAELVSGSRHARKSLGEGEAGLAARGPSNRRRPEIHPTVRRGCGFDFSFGAANLAPAI